MNSSSTSAERTLQPTYIGHIATKQDACLLLEGCLSGKLHHIPRFPWENEGQHVVRSGNTFVYAEVPTGAGSWNDGRSWTLLGHEDVFLVEREGFGSHKFFKKSGSLNVQGVIHHFVSYYKVEDTMRFSGEANSLDEILTQPSEDPKLKDIPLHPDLAILVPRVPTQQALRGGGMRE